MTSAASSRRPAAARARAEAARWLAQAENDLAFAGHGVALGFFAQTCFLAQEVAEKAAKPVPCARGARIAMGYSVDGLLEPLASDVPAVDALRVGAKELDPRYEPTRHPNRLPGNVPFRALTRVQPGRALGDARAILTFAQSAIGARAAAGPGHREAPPPVRRALTLAPVARPDQSTAPGTRGSGVRIPPGASASQVVPLAFEVASFGTSPLTPGGCPWGATTASGSRAFPPAIARRRSISSAFGHVLGSRTEP